MTQPVFSVVVPVYKVEIYLRQCVESILHQSFTDFELILVDDGSPDNCPKICDEYAKIDPRIKVIHQVNMGVSAARNAGIEISTGKYLTFVDGDDYVDEDFLRLLYNNLNGCLISECGTISFNEKTLQKNRYRRKPLELTWEEYLTEKNLNGFLSYAVVFSKIYDRSLFDNVRFPIGRANSEDESVTYKLAFKAKKISRIYKPLYYYRQRSSGASQNTVTEFRIKDSEKFFDEKILFFADKNRLDLAAYFSAKKALCMIGLFKRADGEENKRYCYKIIKTLFSEIKGKRSVPIKYKIFILLFLCQSKFFNKEHSIYCS